MIGLKVRKRTTERTSGKQRSRDTKQEDRRITREKDETGTGEETKTRGQEGQS